MAIPNVTVEVLFDVLRTTWTDVSAYVRSFEINRGSSRWDGPIIRYEAGTASVVLDNRDARFDPTYLSGPYADGNGSQIRPGKKFRIRSTTDGGHILWTGFADGWDLQYPLGGKDAIATLSGTDLVKYLQETNFVGDVVCAAEPSGTRIMNLLSAWHAAGFFVLIDATQLLLLDNGNSTVQAGTISPTWDNMQATSDSELGQLYTRGDGYIVFRQRDAPFKGFSTSAATFGDGGGAELKYDDVHIVNDDVQIKNFVDATNEGGVQQAKWDGNSLTEFGNRNASFSGLLLTTDTESLDYAGYVLATSSGALVENGILKLYGDIHVDSLTVDPQADPTNLNPQVLGRDLGDRITVKVRPPGRAASPISRDAFIRGIQHSATPDTWITRWSLQDATRFAVFTFNHATFGRLDYNFFGM